MAGQAGGAERLCAVGQRQQPYYDDESGKANMWDWYFEQPFLQERPEATWYYGTPWVNQLYHKHGGISPREFLREVLLFRPEVKARAESLLQQYGLRDGYVAVSYRGTDRYTDGSEVVPIERYFSVLDGFRECQMLLLPEEVQARDALLARYSNAVHMKEFHLATNPAGEMLDWTSPKSGRECGMDAVVMLYLFSKAGLLVRNCANLSLLAAQLNPNVSWEIKLNGPPIRYAG